MIACRTWPVSMLLAVAALAGCAMADRRGMPANPQASHDDPAPIVVPTIEHPDGESSQWWFVSGAAHAAANGASRARVRNVILFVGDGMGLTTVAASRILEGQRNGQPGEENMLSFERLPYTALARTYNTNAQTPDSAGTMTAMITGVRTRIGVLSTGPGARRADCRGAADDELVSLLEIAKSAGMATGIVTTTRLTHATPAATYARSPDRNWEDDYSIAPEAAAAGCRDIATQFVEPRIGNGVDVTLAGGRARFLPQTESDPEHARMTGMRRDGRNLIAEWQARHPNGDYVWKTSQLDALDHRSSTPLLGLFEPDHMRFEHDRPGDPGGEPSLAQMTQVAIDRLSRAPDGFVLLVEAGRIDHAHHFGNAYRALVDTIALSDAVRVAVDSTRADETLIVVTADHSHTLTFAGYPARGNPILGKVRGSSGEAETSDTDALDALGLPYTTLGYANGPGYSGASDTQPEGPKRFLHDFSAMAGIRAGRPDLAGVDTAAPDFLQEATVPLLSETHGGEDVAVYARGPGAAAVRGSMEQHVLFHIMLQATPRLRERLCAAGRCNADGIPVEVPRPPDLRP
jgi:alkaline phosphatase